MYNISYAIAYYAFLPSSRVKSILHQFIPGSYVGNCPVLHPHKDTEMPPLGATGLIW